MLLYIQKGGCVYAIDPLVMLVKSFAAGLFFEIFYHFSKQSFKKRITP